MLLKYSTFVRFCLVIINSYGCYFVAPQSDILLIFAPQWSPFQPPLSLPSLAAWLRRERFLVTVVDANILLYEWLLSSDAVPYLRHALVQQHFSDQLKAAYEAIIAAQPQFQSDIEQLRNSRQGLDTFVSHTYLGLKSLETYLAAVSEICGTFRISPYEFRVGRGNVESSHVEGFASNPPSIVEGFLKYLLAQPSFQQSPKAIGISCIGQEQLAFTLLLGRVLKEETDATILIGGTIFSRLYERGNLPEQWFDKYFDAIIRNEGERPTQQILQNLNTPHDVFHNVPGVIYLNGTIQAHPPSRPLKPEELPIPDYDDMPLGRYFTPEVTLPLLASRGCYWGKCEFCHHGMVYGEKYSAYEVESVVQTIETLSKRHGVRHFAFNDEAVPPKILAGLGRTLPASSETGFRFTGLVKFEKYFTEEILSSVSRIGFRSLYVGLESASERVLALMKKPNKQTTIVQNLKDATGAGIWFHCFIFFGFPGETEIDAKITYDFVLEHSDIMGSFGCGTFSLEHNAPIQHHPELFGVTPLSPPGLDLDVYYDYTVSEGISGPLAQEWADRLNNEARQIEKYASTSWIARELLLSLLSRFQPEEIVEQCTVILQSGGIPADARLTEVISLQPNAALHGAGIMINRMNRRVHIARGDYLQRVQLALADDARLSSITPNSTLSKFLAIA